MHSWNDSAEKKKNRAEEHCEAHRAAPDVEEKVASAADAADAAPLDIAGSAKTEYSAHANAAQDSTANNAELTLLAVAEQTDYGRISADCRVEAGAEAQEAAAQIAGHNAAEAAPVPAHKISAVQRWTLAHKKETLDVADQIASSDSQPAYSD